MLFCDINTASVAGSHLLTQGIVRHTSCEWPIHRAPQTLFPQLTSANRPLHLSPRVFNNILQLHVPSRNLDSSLPDTFLPTDPAPPYQPSDPPLFALPPCSSALGFSPPRQLPSPFKLLPAPSLCTFMGLLSSALSNAPTPGAILHAAARAMFLEQIPDHTFTHCPLKIHRCLVEPTVGVLKLSWALGSPGERETFLAIPGKTQALIFSKHSPWGSDEAPLEDPWPAGHTRSRLPFLTLSCAALSHTHWTPLVSLLSLKSQGLCCSCALYLEASRSCSYVDAPSHRSRWAQVSLPQRRPGKAAFPHSGASLLLLLCIGVWNNLCSVSPPVLKLHEGEDLSGTGLWPCLQVLEQHVAYNKNRTTTTGHKGECFLSSDSPPGATENAYRPGDPMWSSQQTSGVGVVTTSISWVKKQGHRRDSNFPKVTSLESGRARTWTQGIWLQSVVTQAIK